MISRVSNILHLPTTFGFDIKAGCWFCTCDGGGGGRLCWYSCAALWSSRVLCSNVTVGGCVLGKLTFDNERDVVPKFVILLADCDVFIELELLFWLLFHGGGTPESDESCAENESCRSFYIICFFF